MANIAAQRIKREFEAMYTSEELDEYTPRIELVDDNCMEIKGVIEGPPNTPYEGGKFVLEIKVPDNYPFYPPKVRFKTKIWHPNISSVTGHICSNTLKDQWVATLTLRVVLLSLQAFMAAADPDNPLDINVARQYTDNPEMFGLTASHWTSVYAGGPNRNRNFESKIRHLTDLDVDEDKAIVTLSNFDWDLQTALAKLFV